MEYICIAVILGIFGGIYNSPIFFIIVILTGISIYILLAIFKNKIFNYNLDLKMIGKYILKNIIIIIVIMLLMFLKIQNKEKQINDIYEIDKKSKNGEYIVSIIDKKKGKNKSTYTVIFKDINSYHLLAISGSHMAYLMVIIEFLVKKIKIRKRKYKHYYNINNWNVYCPCRIFTCSFKSWNI